MRECKTVLDYMKYIHFKRENYTILVFDIIEDLKKYGYKFKDGAFENLMTIIAKKDIEVFSKECFMVELDTHNGKYKEFKTVYNMTDEEKVKKMISKNKLIHSDETSLIYWMYNIYGIPKHLLILEMISRINDIIFKGPHTEIPVDRDKIFDNVRDELAKTLLPTSVIENYYMKTFINLYNNLIVGKQLNVEDETVEGFIKTYFIK